MREMEDLSQLLKDDDFQKTYESALTDWMEETSRQSVKEHLQLFSNLVTTLETVLHSTIKDRLETSKAFCEAARNLYESKALRALHKATFDEPIIYVFERRLRHVATYFLGCKFIADACIRKWKRGTRDIDDRLEIIWVADYLAEFQKVPPVVTSTMTVGDLLDHFSPRMFPQIRQELLQQMPVADGGTALTPMFHSQTQLATYILRTEASAGCIGTDAPCCFACQVYLKTTGCKYSDKCLDVKLDWLAPLQVTEVKEMSRVLLSRLKEHVQDHKTQLNTTIELRITESIRDEEEQDEGEDEDD